MTSLSVRIMWLEDMLAGMRYKAKKSDIRCWARTNRHIIKNKKNKNKEKYDHYYISELLLKVAFNTINHKKDMNPTIFFLAENFVIWSKQYLISHSRTFYYCLMNHNTFRHVLRAFTAT